MNPKFITVEGVEGAGKSSVINFIKNYFAEKKISCVFTRETGGTEIAELIRNILHSHHQEEMYPDTELLLAFASRAQHLNKLIIPTLNSGKWVLSDRFTDSTYAYQGAGRGIPQEKIALLENLVQGNLRPNFTLLLDLDPEIGLERISKADLKFDRFETEKIEFYVRVRNCFLERAKNEPQRFRKVDASKSIKDVELQIKQIFDTIL